MKTALDLLREALAPDMIFACVTELIRDQTRSGRSIADRAFLQDVCNLTRLRRMVVNGEVEVKA